MNRFDSLDVPLDDMQSGSLNGQLARGTHESTDVVALLQRLQNEFPPRTASRTKDEDPHVEDPPGSLRTVLLRFHRQKVLLRALHGGNRQSAIDVDDAQHADRAVLGNDDGAHVLSGRELVVRESDRVAGGPVEDGQLYHATAAAMTSPASNPATRPAVNSGAFTSSSLAPRPPVGAPTEVRPLEVR